MSNLTAGQRWGRWHWVRVLGLRCFYFPYHDVRWRLVAAWRAMHYGNYIITDKECMDITTPLEEHNFEWLHPCNCATCRSYADE